MNDDDNNAVKIFAALWDAEIHLKIAKLLCPLSLQVLVPVVVVATVPSLRTAVVLRYGVYVRCLLYVLDTAPDVSCSHALSNHLRAAMEEYVSQ